MFPTAGQVPTRYSPVRHSWIAPVVRLACIRHAASVRSEPGSNSQVDFRCELEPGSRKTRTRTASDDKSFIPHIFKRFASDARNDSSMGDQTHPQSRRPRIPSSFTCPRTQRPEPEGPDREKPAKGRKAEAFLAFAGARLIGWAKGPVKPISEPHSNPARKPQPALPAHQGRTAAKLLTDSDRPPPVRRRPE